MKDVIRMFLKMQDSIELMFEEHFQGNFQINFSWDQRICQIALFVCIVSSEKEFVIFWLTYSSILPNMWRTLALVLISGLSLAFMDLCKRNTQKQIETSTRMSFNDTSTERTEILKEIQRIRFEFGSKLDYVIETRIQGIVCGISNYCFCWKRHT